jgi:hypothetical protein
MVPIENALKDLSSLATRLKSETEELNEVIASLSDRLKATGIGVSAWTGQLLAEKDRTEGDIRVRSGWELGYAKVDDTWTIAVRKTSGQLVGPDEVETWVDEDPMPLLKAPRNVRVESAEHLERLVETISEKARRFIASIAKAKKLK